MHDSNVTARASMKFTTNSSIYCEYEMSSKYRVHVTQFKSITQSSYEPHLTHFFVSR